MNDMYYNDYMNSIYSYNNQNINYEPREFQVKKENFYSGNRGDSFFNPLEGFAKGNMQANIYKPYKIVNMSTPQVHNEREKLLLEVQKYSFAMWDLNLYLNTHPTDRNVMKLYDSYRELYKEALARYENKYGSLTVNETSTSEGYWMWNKSPWPWEVE